METLETKDDVLGPSVAALIINWNGHADTVDCLASLRDQNYRPFSIYLLDNASTDGSVGYIQQSLRQLGLSAAMYSANSGSGCSLSLECNWPGRKPRVHFIISEENVGFCCGNNLLARTALGHGVDYILVLNNDTICHPDLLVHLVEAAKEMPTPSVLSPLICYEPDRERVWWCGGDFSALLVPTYRGQEGAKPRISATGRIPTLPSMWASGCATFVPRGVIEAIGLYDEDFFIWCEEWDFSLRARASGIAIAVVPQAEVYHKVGKSLGIVSPLTYFYGTRNMLILRRRHLHVCLWLPVLLLTLPHKLSQALRLAFRERDARFLLAYWDILRNPLRPLVGKWKRQLA